MQSVGAPWLMTSLTRNPLYIALIQTASALPFFLLALSVGNHLSDEPVFRPSEENSFLNTIFPHLHP
jgi:hypothetical protein